jgi:hypothetical protein
MLFGYRHRGDHFRGVLVHLDVSGHRQCRTRHSCRRRVWRMVLLWTSVCGRYAQAPVSERVRPRQHTLAWQYCVRQPHRHYPRNDPTNVPDDTKQCESGGSPCGDDLRVHRTVYCGMHSELGRVLQQVSRTYQRLSRSCER